MISVMRRAHAFPRPNSCLNEFVHIERLVVFKHEIDGACDLVAEDAQSLALAVAFLEPDNEGFDPLGFAQHDDGGLRDGPFEVGIADFLIGFAGPLTIGHFLGSNQAGIG